MKQVGENSVSSPYCPLCPPPEPLDEALGYLFYAADGKDGLELYKTDGSSEIQIADILQVPEGSYPNQFVEFNDVLLFSASMPGTEQLALYKTDGVEVTKIDDIYPHLGSGAPFVVDDRMIFAALGPNGYEPYWTDGTTAGEIADIVVGPSDSDVSVPRSAPFYLALE